MFSKATRKLTIVAAKKLLYTDHPETLGTAKRLLSVVAGAYIIQRGLKDIFKHPVLSIQETILGGVLIYNAVKSSEEEEARKYRESLKVHKAPLSIHGIEPVV